MAGMVHLKDFTAGLDARRIVETVGPGFLIKAVDCHIDRGGQVEQRAAFVLAYELEEGRSVGLAADSNGLIVFGSGAAPTLPAGFAYQELVLSTKTLERVMSWDLYDGKVYAAVRFDDGFKAHYYDATLVDDFDTGGGGADYQAGDFVLTYETKMYALSGSVVHFSDVANPIEFDGALGAGFVDMASVAGEAKELTAMAPYQGYMAVFAPRAVLIYYFDVDPDLSKKIQVLTNIGTRYPLSVAQFGDSDVFFLDSSGVRSLQARDASNAAATSDIGVMIDELVRAKLRTMTVEQRSRIIGLIEPGDNRFWLIMRDEIFVYSFFEGSRVRAWTTYLPGFDIDAAAIFNDRVYVRSGDNIYVYGGLGDEPTYDATAAEAWTAFLDAETPVSAKTWDRLAVACEGSWEVRIAMKTTNPLASDLVATITDTTFDDEKIPLEGKSTHVSLRFRAAAPGAKKISAAVITHK